MKKLILSAMLMAFTVMASAITITVNNTSNTLGTCDGCDYEVSLKNITFKKAGSLNWGFTETGYTNITPGNSKVWTLSPPSGYTPDWSTLQIRVRWCSNIHIFGNGANSDNFNNCDCGSTFKQTYWFRNSDGNYDVQCEDLEFRRGAVGEDQIFETITQETLPGYLTSVTPNPSVGLYTITPGTDLKGKTFDVQVIDASGKTVFNKQGASGDAPLNMDLTVLPKGIYLLNIVSADKKQSLRLMKE